MNTITRATILAVVMILMILMITTYSLPLAREPGGHLGEPQAKDREGAKAAHFHHVHLNVIDSSASVQFYMKFFGATRVKYRGRTDALFTEKSFILLTTVDSPPPTHLTTSLWHIGWAGVDGPSEYDWRKAKGIEVHTPLTALGSNHYMYFLGPDKETVEVYTGSKNHRFEHVHLIATDVNATVKWFVDHLGLKARRNHVPKPDPGSGLWANSIRVDNVNLIVFGKVDGKRRPRWYPEELGDEFAPTKGTVIDHIAFSFREITPVYERMKSAGVEVVQPIKEDERHGLKSFFVLAPDKLLVEIVEDKPIPEGIWE